MSRAQCAPAVSEVDLQRSARVWQACRPEAHHSARALPGGLCHTRLVPLGVKVAEQHQRGACRCARQQQQQQHQQQQRLLLRRRRGSSRQQQRRRRRRQQQRRRLVGHHCTKCPAACTLRVSPSHWSTHASACSPPALVVPLRCMLAACRHRWWAGDGGWAGQHLQGSQLRQQQLG